MARQSAQRKHLSTKTSQHSDIDARPQTHPSADGTCSTERERVNDIGPPPDLPSMNTTCQGHAIPKRELTGLPGQLFATVPAGYAFSCLW